MGGCPSDEALQRVARGSGDASAQSHASTCARCQSKVASLRGETVELAATAASGNPAVEATLASPSARPVETDATLASPGPGDTRAPTVPSERIGRYIASRLLGAGAMGRVLEAQDPQLQRTIALKLALGGSNEELRARLLREAQAAARVRHPNVVTVHDAGTHGDEVFIAMELVPGGSLRTWLESPREWRDVVRVFLGAARGLAAVHAAGLVHRDFKPDNVLLEHDGTARVSDFGLVGRDAAVVAEPATRTSAWDLTATGALMGTPAYMAPELFQRQPATPAADQFAFCVALFEALEGKRPFHATSLAELERVVCEGNAAPLTASVPRWLVAVVKRGMEADPAQRHPSMDAVIDALAAGIAPRRTARWYAVGAGVAAMAAIAGVGLWPDEHNVCSGGASRAGTVWSPARKASIANAIAATNLPWAPPLWAQAEQHLDDWTDAFVVGHRDACEDTRVRKEQTAQVMDARMRCLDERLREVDAFLGVMESPDEKAIHAGTRAAADLPTVTACANLAWVTQRTSPPTDPAAMKAYTTFQAALERAKAQRRAGHLARTAQELDAVATELDAAPPEVRAAYELERGEQLFGASKFDDARTVLWNAARDFPSSRDAELGFRVWRALAAVELTERNLDEARRFAELARGQLESLGKPPELEADLEKILGLIESNSGKTDAALAHLNRSLALNHGITGDRRVQIAEDEINLSSEYIRLRKPEDAIAHLNKAVALYDELYGKDHLLSATPLNNLSVALRQKGEREEALKVSRRVVAIREKYLPPDHLDLGKAYNNLGRALDELDDIDGAIAAYRRSRDIRIKAVGVNAPEVAMMRSNIAGMLERQGKFEEADREYAAAIAALADAKDPALPAQVWLGRGSMQLAQKDARAATESFQAAVTLYRSTFPDDHPTLCWVWSSLGQAHLALRDYVKAEPPLDNALACYGKRTDRTEADDQELEVSSFYKGRLLVEARRNRTAGVKMIERAWRWAHEHGDTFSVQLIGDWARSARVKLPKLALLKP